MTSFHLMIWSFDPLFLIIDSHTEIRHHPRTGSTCFPDFSFFWDLKIVKSVRSSRMSLPWDCWFEILVSMEYNCRGASFGLPPSLSLWVLFDLVGSVLFIQIDTISERPFSRTILLIWEMSNDSPGISWESPDSHGTVGNLDFSYFTSFYVETINLLPPSEPGRQINGSEGSVGLHSLQLACFIKYREFSFFLSFFFYFISFDFYKAHTLPHPNQLLSAHW